MKRLPHLLQVKIAKQNKEVSIFLSGFVTSLPHLGQTAIRETHFESWTHLHSITKIRRHVGTLRYNRIFSQDFALQLTQFQTLKWLTIQKYYIVSYRKNLAGNALG